MKRKIVLFLAALSVASCSWLNTSPTTTVRNFLNAAKKGDVEGMNKLFSKRAIQRTGIERINSNNKDFAEMSQRAHEGGSFSMDQVEETREVNTAFVSFVYRKNDGSDSLGLGFYLSKEDGTWKIDNIGGRERDDLADINKPPPFPSVEWTPAPTPRDGFASNSNSASSDTTSKPISAGVLNGKATSLPKPPYPPIAKAAKASGTVVVQVLVDENGNVVSASPVSGHPLLRAAAVAAARQARFTPTKLSGRAVKVSGVITYNFVPD